MRIKFDKKKSNQIIRDKIEKQFQLRKKRKTKNNNKKNENQIWYKNQISRNEIEKKFNKTFKTKYIVIKRMRTKFDIKIKCQRMKWKIKKLIQ